MEEILKENEKDFLDYINFKKEQEEEIKRINNDINKIKSDIIVNNLKIGKKPYLEIEQRKLRIEQIKEKITNLEIGREVNRIKETNQSDKDIADFNIIVEIEKLKKEQQKLEEEITEIVNACKNSITTKDAQEKINCMQRIRKTIEQRIADRRHLLEEIIDRKIELKEEVLLKISEKMKETINEIEINIQEKEKTLKNLTKIEFEDEDNEYLYELKQKTLARLEEELDKMKSKLHEEKNNFKNIYSINKSELDEFKKLKEDLNSEDLSKLENDLGIQQEEKEKEKAEIKNTNINKEEKTVPNAWVPDGFGGWKPGIKDENEKRSKSIFKDKIFLVVDKIKGMLSKQNKKSSGEIKENNSIPPLAERIKCKTEDSEIEFINYLNKEFEDKEK